MLEINVNIQGLDGLVEVLKGLIVSTPVSSEIKTGEAFFQTSPIVNQQPITTPVTEQQTPPVVTQQSISAPIQQIPPFNVPINQTAPPVPTTEVNYNFDQLAVAASSLMDAGRMADIQALLSRYSAPSLTQLQKEQYGAFANELRRMGAKL
jgi:hypothetical protein